MAQDTALLLRGLGAAFANRVPQLRQELAQEQEAQYLQQQRGRQELEFQQAQQDRQTQQREALIKASFQDSQAGLIALSQGNLDAVLNIAEQGAQAAIEAGIDPSGYTRILESAKLARAGNPRGWNDLRTGLLQSVQIGTAKGYITPPEEAEYTLKPGETRMKGSREIASIPADDRGYRMLSAQEVAQMGLESGGSYQVNEKTGQVSRIGTPLMETDPNASLYAGIDKLLLGDFEAASTSASAAPQLQMLSVLAPLTTEGRIPAEISRVFPGYNEPNAAFIGIVNQVLPSLRVPGSGAQSDKDIEVLINSIGNLAFSTDVKRLLVRSMQEKNNINQERAAIAEKVLSGELSRLDAMRQRRELNSRSILNPELQALLEGVAGIPKAAIDAGLTPDDWGNMTDAEKAAFGGQ